MLELINHQGITRWIDRAGLPVTGGDFDASGRLRAAAA
jgi:hypothetical protein